MNDRLPNVAKEDEKSLRTVTSLGSEILKIVTAVLTSKDKTEAAERLGVSRMTLWRKVKKYDMDKYLEEVPEETFKIIKGASLQAALNIVEDLRDGNPVIRQAASKYILDKILPNKPSVQINTQINQYKDLSDHELDELIKQTTGQVASSGSLMGEEKTP